MTPATYTIPFWLDFLTRWLGILILSHLSLWSIFSRNRWLSLALAKCASGILKSGSSTLLRCFYRWVGHLLLSAAWCGWGGAWRSEPACFQISSMWHGAGRCHGVCCCFRWVECCAGAVLAQSGSGLDISVAAYCWERRISWNFAGLSQ